MPHDWINVHVDGDADARTVVKQCARCRLLAVVHESGTRAAIDYHPLHIRAPQDCPRGDMTEERASETAALRADLTAAIARAEAAEKERDRMRPVVSAAVKYDAALREYSERGDDDPEFQRPVTIAESALTEAVTAYLAATPKEPR